MLIEKRDSYFIRDTAGYWAFRELTQASAAQCVDAVFDSPYGLADGGYAVLGSDSRQPVMLPENMSFFATLAIMADGLAAA